MAMLSHLSDAQEQIRLMHGDSLLANQTCDTINFVKVLLNRYHDTQVEVETSELDRQWSNFYNR